MKTRSLTLLYFAKYSVHFPWVHYFHFFFPLLGKSCSLVNHMVRMNLIILTTENCCTSSICCCWLWPAQLPPQVSTRANHSRHHFIVFHFSPGKAIVCCFLLCLSQGTDVKDFYMGFTLWQWHWWNPQWPTRICSPETIVQCPSHACKID